MEGKKSASNLTAKYGDDKALFIKCDVTTDLEDVSKKIFKGYEVDLLVNNAGIVDESSIRKVMEVNSIAVMEWSMKFFEHMRTDKGGRGGTIINIGSIYSYAVDSYVVIYKASVFSVMGLTRSLGHADNFAKFGVRVVIICPGFTKTSLTDGKLCWDEHVDDFTKFAGTQPWQTADEVGKAAVEVYRFAGSGSAWKIAGGILSEVPLVAEGEFWR